MKRLMIGLCSLALAACTAVPGAHAAYDRDDLPVSQANVAAPPLLAGRLTVADGDARIWRTTEDGSGYWDDAEPNDVVTVQSGLFTGDSGRLEVRFGPHALRLAERSRGGFARLDYDNAQFNLESGMLNLRLRDADARDRFSVSVGALQFELAPSGRYRIDALEGRPVRVSVFRGQAILHTPGATMTLNAGQALDIGGNGNQYVSAPMVTTDFDEWASRRDDLFRPSQAPQYVSHYMTGYEDLDAYGQWTADATYGTVWVPRTVPVGWVPYREGRWRWIAPWGWTWVDAAPWGFAPFHYGRWVTIGGRWCWWPGQRELRPVFAPALVSWVGAPGWSVSIGVGTPNFVGWYPLAPWETYQPYYTTNVTYVHAINRHVMPQPPHGYLPGWNQRDGSTIVRGPDFPQPIRRPIHTDVPRPNLDQLRPVTPPSLMPGVRTPSSPGVRPMPDAQKELPGRVPTPRVERGPQYTPTPVPPAPVQGAPVRPQPIQPMPTQPSPHVPTPIVRPPQDRDIAPTPRKPLPAPQPSAPQLPPPEAHNPRAPAPIYRGAPVERGPAAQEPERRVTIPERNDRVERDHGDRKEPNAARKEPASKSGGDDGRPGGGKWDR